MKYTIEIPIECGDRTCASKKGEFCCRMGSRKFGGIPVCMVFNKDLEEKDGWTQRCPECLKATEGSVKRG